MRIGWAAMFLIAGCFDPQSGDLEGQEPSAAEICSLAGIGPSLLARIVDVTAGAQSSRASCTSQGHYAFVLSGASCDTEATVAITATEFAPRIEVISEDGCTFDSDTKTARLVIKIPANLFVVPVVSSAQGNCLDFTLAVESVTACPPPT